MITPKIPLLKDGQILSVDVVNSIIKRTEYAGDLLKQSKLIAGDGVTIQPQYNGTRVSVSGGNMYIGIAASTGGSVSTQIVGLFTINGQTAIIGNVLGTAEQLDVNAYFLTRNLQLQVGAIWASNKVFSSSFTAQFGYFIAGSAQADGITLIFSPEIFLGGTGGGLGYQGGPTNSVAVEIDIFQNSPFDPNNSHIAVLKGGDVTTHLAIASPTVRPSGTLSVTYSNKILNVFHNGIQIIGHGIDIPSIIG
jgi:hypothetical protein